MKRWTLVAMFLLAGLDAGAQRRPPRRPPRGQTHSNTPTTTPVTVAPAPTGPELVSVPIADVDRMMRQMRVWLFTPPPGATGYGLGRVAEGGGGARVWALLPSCRQANPDDPRDPCPVDRVIITSEDAGGNVQSMDPQGLAPGAEARRVQSFMVPTGVRRVHIKLMALNNRVRYEAIVDVERLQDLPPPQGSPAANGFNFELAQYPAR